MNTEGTPLTVNYWRSRWSAFEVGEGDVKYRDTLAEVVLGPEVIGGFQLCEFRATTLTSSEMFLEALDSGSQATFAVGEAICAHWEYVDDITDYGDILELHRAWIAPAHSRRGRLTAAITATVEALHTRHALVILKAFPLEYEGNVTDEFEVAFGRRRAALMRHYAATLGMRPFPDDTGEEGWMYAVPERLRHVDGLTPSPLASVPALHRF